MKESEPVIQSAQEIMSGAPVIVGTCMPLTTLPDYLEGRQALPNFSTW
jgi:uncharacterized protein (DUF433 family)